MMRSLLWKEWHEQGWRIAFGCVMVGAFVALGLNVRVLPDEAIVMFTVLFAAFIIPQLMAMGLTAPEHAEGTLTSLFTLPVAPWKWLTSKLIFAALGCVLPLITAGAITAAIAGSREFALSRSLTLYTGTAVFATVYMLWIALLGARQPSEARVGLIGIGLFIVFVIALILSAFSEPFHSIPGPAFLGPALWVTNPLALLWLTLDLVNQQSTGFHNHGGPAVLISQSILTVLVIAWLLNRRYRNLDKVRP